jgi:hypothetical protein
MTRHVDTTSSGTVSTHSRHPRITSLARSAGQNITPAYKSGTSNSLISIAVTTPKPPPPPRTAQNRSGSLSRSVHTRLPSAVTSSTAVTWLAARPPLRASQLIPPPGV